MIEKELMILNGVRTNPRKMREDYLKKNGIWDIILFHTNDESFHKFSVRDRIDYIIDNKKDIFCFCGERVKPGKIYCSAACVGKSPTTKEKLSKTQKENKVSRYKKTKETWKKKYGVEHNLSDPTIQEKVAKKRQSWIDKTTEETFEKYGLNLQKFQDKEFLLSITDECVSIEHIRNEYFGGMPKMTIHRFLTKMLGHSNFAKASSYAEKEILDFTTSLVPDYKVMNNVRTVINNRELDIFIPDKNLAIEYHGLYWHSGINHYNVHFEKYKKCLEKNIFLIQIFEDEWIIKPEIVKSIIKSKLGKTNKIYGRNCVIKDVNKTEANIFLNENHLQGSIGGTSFGLYYEEELISIFTISKTRFNNKEAQWELVRYSSKNDVTVIGGFSKLLNHFKKKYNNEPLLSYCDLRYSQGVTYEKFGKYLRTNKPNYFWVKNNERISRHKTQKHKLKDFLVDFDHNKTEKENMIDNDYKQIWDCGNKVYIL